ncbi:MAG: hypothetical protein ACKO4Z_11980 [Planctomycetota bacterium]
MSESPDIMLTLGRCDEMRAEVYLSPSAPTPHGARLEGLLIGPYRRQDLTLPMEARLEPMTDLPGRGVVSRVVLTEPAFWSPESPNLYRAAIRLEAAGMSPTTVDTGVGLRRLGVRGRSFWLDGRRWVPRAAALRGGADVAWAAETGIVATAPGDDLLSRADELGVAVVTLVESSELTGPRLAALSRHPAALMVIVVDGGRPDSLGGVAGEIRRAKGTMQIGIAVDAGLPVPAVPEGFDFMAVRLAADRLPHESWRRLPECPLVAWRHALALEPPSARAACTTLQRDLAAWAAAADGAHPVWDWAGYLVGTA